MSASEVSKLKAENWCLKNSLNDTIEANENMQQLVKKVVQEKYNALDELQKLTWLNELMQVQVKEERDLNAEEKKSLLDEVLRLKDKTYQQHELIVRH